MAIHEHVKSFVDGEVYAYWEPAGAIILKAVAASGDPVELSNNEARAIGEHLLKLAEIDEAGPE